MCELPHIGFRLSRMNSRTVCNTGYFAYVSRSVGSTSVTISSLCFLSRRAARAKNGLCGRTKEQPSAFLRTAADRLHQVENDSVFGLAGGRDEDVPRHLQRRPQLQSRALPGRKETWCAEPEAEQ